MIETPITTGLIPVVIDSVFTNRTVPVAVMKKYHATDEVIRETMEKLNKGQVKEGMLIYSAYK